MSDRDYIENRIPNPGPGSHRRRKPVLTVLPQGVSAEEAARLLRELAARHAGDGDAKTDEGRRPRSSDTR